MLICPLCSAALGEVDNGVARPAGHRFDRARQGPEPAAGAAQEKPRSGRQRRHGRGPSPVPRRRPLRAAGPAPGRNWPPNARRDAGWISAAARATTAPGSAKPWPAPRATPLDISREAVKRACRRAPQLSWLVASMARLPLADASCELIASVFSPIDWNEARPRPRRRRTAPGPGQRAPAGTAPAAL